jgi:hypothetical protein
MSELFNKHGRPNFAGVLENMSEEDAYAACEDYEDYVYSIAESLSEDEWDRMIADVHAVWAEFFAFPGSDD